MASRLPMRKAIPTVDALADIDAQMRDLTKERNKLRNRLTPGFKYCGTEHTLSVTTITSDRVDTGHLRLHYPDVFDRVKRKVSGIRYTFDRVAVLDTDTSGE